MALPDDFNKIFGSTATGGITPINDVNYAKGWEFVGANPPTKNDFTYLQYMGDVKSQWLYNNNYGRLLGAPKVYTASGSYTPAANVKAIIVEVVGGGGGGGYAISSGSYNAAAGGGGAGGYSKKYIPITSQTPIPYTIGTGGTRGIASSRTGPTSGGTSSFGTFLSASGGLGGGNAIASSAAASAASGGSGGSGALGIINSNGGSGMSSVVSSAAAGSSAGYGFGGQSMLSGQPGYGAGGNGGQTAGGNQSIDGSNGSNGVIIITEYA